MPWRTRRKEIADVALDTAAPVLEFTESALELVPIPGLALIAKGLGIIVDRVQDARMNNDARNAFISKAKALDVTLMELVKKTSTAVDSSGGDERIKKRLVDGVAQSEELQLRLQTLSSTIVELRERTKELKGGDGAIGFLKGFLFASRNEAILSDMKDEMANAVEMFKLRGQISIENVLSDIVIDSISWAPAGYRSVDELKSEFMEGTREELFDELDAWSNGRFPQDDPRRFYALTGGAGLGKSSIAHQFCTRLDKPGQPTLGASFFFVRGSGDLESTRLFFSTLAHQLALSQPTLRPHIVDAAREYHKHGDRQQMQHAFEELLRDPLARAPIPGETPVILVIDGLDECKERDLMRSMLGFVLELTRTLPWLQVFATSRPEPHVMSVLTSPEVARIVHHRSLNDTLEEWEGDVRHYLEATVPKILQYGAFIRDNPDVLERLIIRTGGVFIYAHVAARFLDSYHDRPEEQFELLLASGGAGLSPLDSLYLQVLRSAFPPEDLRVSNPRQERSRSLLTSIVLQTHPLAPGVIALLGHELSENDVVAMVDRLRSILLIDQDGLVRPLHATFGEFLLDDKRCSDPLYHVDRSKGHARLASACLTALTSFRTLLGCLEAGLDSHLSSYVYYARGNWDYHLGIAEFSDSLAQQVCAMVPMIPAYIGVYTSNFGESGVTASMAQFLEVGNTV
ncbi:uncharacterized protein PHACADRAFT_105915 [Phanerochaete carnosa HHB-10118-sp]|uniref:NACHT domain-containing protein n=1 Tax=Phanerochaete carnosa (strain HHB-10118-sp) TaxID=650164 RepID=K5UKI6_PHACS|nr:uncharacterized protein PHACADRAFT_105915 [Phanerochaete carnosa HHB-10118-sp]EKM50151.1 hypothetical protein PHACADRAFT_105915 [Phanerochaete carnosa HHB-10118-sp]